ncbi:uncharacterized protein LOC115747397 [Rhodamnia argentea]|uniref:Uncharacterized protein LOC115747397 n=1 Tax=Rhodamnia argentea TaxID=178133 RepID=A0A8B8PX99_9MYRT|nr:uncharacterized protein LOC115747397 [Rhodamnia argentea]
METPEKRVAGIALDFPATDGAASYSWPPRMPRRLRRRLLAECSKSPASVEEIEAKLRDADLRRQQFYEKLSSKARPKQRSPSRASSSEEDLGHRLEAKLQAAEQKRLSMLAEAQMRLAKLDEIRQAAKNGVQLRQEMKREKLGSKVEFRFQQAQVNRMLILKAYKQRRATIRERSSQSLLRRMLRESKYKERVRAAINQKRAAAEKKRLRLLEAEMKRARARVLQVRNVAKSVSHQREVERKKMQDQLEDRLQRAKRQRAEYLRQRGKLRDFAKPSRSIMLRQADLLSRKLARCWRRFLKVRRTTFDLAKAYDMLGINETDVNSMPFEQLAMLIESSDTIHAVKALLDRLESRLRVSGSVAAANQRSSVGNIDHLLKRVATPRKRSSSRVSTRGKELKKIGSNREVAKGPAKISRYPVRVVLCAYMILGHPDAVFSGQGEREIALAMSAREFVRELELLMKIILDGPIQSSDEESDSAIPKRWTFRSQLAAFDKAWCAYLNNFVMWKVRDAKLLEDDLVRAACQLELSMLQTCKLSTEGETGLLTHDMKAIQKQVIEDQKLLREKIQHLGGDAGIERMECALSETRSKYFQATGEGSPSGSPMSNVLSPSSASSSDGSSIASNERRKLSEDDERPNRVVRSLFREDVTPLPNEFGSLSLESDGRTGTSGIQLATENEMIVNALLHEQRPILLNGFSTKSDNENSIKGKIRQAMEKAFWDGIMESIEGNDPQYDRVVQLMMEMRDEICDIAPQSWNEGITEAIDLDILSQVLKSGNLDIDYLAKILVFALGTVQKLSSPANDDKQKTSHQQLLKELAEICEERNGSKNPHAIAMIKGLRFVLEQIQALKLEISQARVKMMEPILKGPAGYDYLRAAFSRCHGHPSDALTVLPAAVQWLSSLKNGVDQEWNEHTTSLSSLLSQESLSQGYTPPTTLRTGGSFLVNTNGNRSLLPGDSGDKTGNPIQECKGERVDLLVRIGLLKLVSRVSALTHDALPETFMLNLPRLRAVQAQMQKIVVISTSILVCRQTLLSERVVTSATDMEGILSDCIQKVIELLDRVEDVGIEEIVEILSKFPVNSEEAVDTKSHRSRKVVMARMLGKSLQAGDPVFERVSLAVYLAARAVVLGGNPPIAKKLAETALRPIGAVVLTPRVVEAAEVLAVAASVSVRVHGPWYGCIVDSL